MCLRGWEAQVEIAIEAGFSFWMHPLGIYAFFVVSALVSGSA